MTADWTPEYARWRHGGWYVTNITTANGAAGCVSRNYDDHKWRIVCDPRPGAYPGGPDDHTYPSRDAAARAERDVWRDVRYAASEQRRKDTLALRGVS